jgi:hypothetical protein
MWHLIEDFFEQSWIIKLFTLWGWLCVVIMLTSVYSTVRSQECLGAIFGSECHVAERAE